MTLFIVDTAVKSLKDDRRVESEAKEALKEEREMLKQKLGIVFFFVFPIGHPLEI